MSAERRGGARALTGFAHQARRESGRWWTTRRGWTSALVWVAVVNGLLALLLWVVPRLPATPGMADMATGELALQFTGLATILAGAGVVLMSQGVLIDDRRDGVLEWLLSKPLSRPGLIAAKFAGHAPALVLTAVVAPWLGVYVQLSLADGGAWPVGRWLAAVALVGLLVAFQLSLVLLLSTLTSSRAVVLALPLAALVGVDLATTLAPWTVEWLPWGLGRVAGLVLSQGMLASAQLVIATIVATTLCLLAAAWRFERAEL